MQETRLLTKNDLQLLETSKKHIEKCYREGITSMASALRTKKGNVYTGINVKYRNIWKCMCAERIAIAKALEAGETEFDIIVTIKYFPETKKYTVVNMCGECRQIAIYHRPLQVVIDDNGVLKTFSIEELSPCPYI